MLNPAQLSCQIASISFCLFLLLQIGENNKITFVLPVCARLASTIQDNKNQHPEIIPLCNGMEFFRSYIFDTRSLKILFSHFHIPLSDWAGAALNPDSFNQAKLTQIRTRLLQQQCWWSLDHFCLISIGRVKLIYWATNIVVCFSRPLSSSPNAWVTSLWVTVKSCRTTMSPIHHVEANEMLLLLVLVLVLVFVFVLEPMSK